MFDAKQLSDEQVSLVRQWAAEGGQLADIQKRLEAEMEFRLSYMDTRFLVLDLGVEIRNLDQEAAEKEKAQQAELPDAQDEFKQEGELTEDDIEVLPPAGASNVKVSVDDIARPRLMASGRVTFADGNGGMWYVDEMGRLGIDPEVEGYQPSEADIQAFQRELQSVMESR